MTVDPDQPLGVADASWDFTAGLDDLDEDQWDYIGIAQGILMEQYGLDSSATMAMLVYASISARVELHVVAESFVRTRQQIW